MSGGGMIGLLWVAAAVAGVYWWLRFGRVLPLEREVYRRQAMVRAIVEFLRGVGGSMRVPKDEVAMRELIREAADRMSVRIPSLGLVVWVRDGMKPELVHQAGLLADASPQEIGIHQDVWARAFNGGSPIRALDGDGWGSVTNPEESWLGCAPAGFHAVRILPWGRPEGFHGFILACDREVAGPALVRAGPLLEVLADYFNLMSQVGGGFLDLQMSRKRLQQDISALHQVASAIKAHEDTPVATLSALVSIVAKSLQADLCAFLLYDDKAGELVTQPGAYGLSGDEGALYRMPVTNEKSSSVRVFLTGVPFMTTDAQSDPRVISDYTRRWRCHSLVVVPLVVENRRIGVMRVGSFQRGFFTQDHLRLLQLIAEEAVVLVESVLLTRKLAEANQKLSDLSQLKDEFVSTVSHEFKTPLTAIKGFLAILLEGEVGPITPEQKRFLTIANSAADRLTALVTDLLDLSRLEAGVRMELQPLSMAGLLEDCLRNHATQAELRAIDLRMAKIQKLPPVLGDPKWLHQALDNLVSNALKFTPSGGCVNLSATDHGGMVRVTVQDNGVGISPEDIGRVFERFYRANNRDLTNPPGTGLGLAIVKYIIDKHEGRVWVESEVGHGSRFHFILPVAGAQEPAEVSKA